MMPNGWESSEAPCPRRGPGLTHIQDRSMRPEGHCGFCGVRILFPAQMVTGPDPTQSNEQAFDLNKILQSMGLLPDESLEPGCILDHASLRHGAECIHCHIVHEGRLITDLGPQGNPNAIGRGVLTERQAMRLLRYVAFAESHGRER